MNVRAFLEELQALDIFLRLEGGRLICNAPEGALTEDLRHAIKDHREELIEFLQHGASLEASDSAVIPLQNEGDGAPLFCICGVHLYSQLAQSFNEERPVYGVFLPPEEEMPAADLIERSRPSKHGKYGEPLVVPLATRYVDAIRAKQPHGPYHLAGVCFGGVLAYEIAQQLRVQEEEVATLTLMETTLARGWHRRPLHWLFGHLLLLLREGPSYFFQVLARRFPRAQALEASLKDDTSSLEADLEKVGGAVYIRAARNYETSMRPYPGRILSIEAADEDHFVGYYLDPGGGFAEFAQGGIEVQHVSGTHLGILNEENAPKVASIMRAHIQSAAARQPCLKA